MYSGIFLCRPSSWSRRTTNSMPMVDRAGRKPHCSSGSICCASQKSLRRLATILSSTLSAWETSEIPRKLLQSDRSDFLWSTLIVAYFHPCGISSPLHTRTRMAWKCLRTTGSRVGSFSLSSSTGSESAPGAFQFAIARTAFCVSAYVGSASRDIGSTICDLAPGGGGGGAFLRCCTFSTMDGWSAGDLVLSRLPKNLSHRRRMSPLPRSRLSFSSLMACCPSVFLSPRPAVIFRRLCKPLMSRCQIISVSSSATYSSKWTSIPLSIASRTSLHAARSAFHVAVVCLVLHCRRASRFLSSAAKNAALTAGRSHHPSLRGIRLVSGRTACAAPIMASANTLNGCQRQQQNTYYTRASFCLKKRDQTLFIPIIVCALQ